MRCCDVEVAPLRLFQLSSGVWCGALRKWDGVWMDGKDILSDADADASLREKGGKALSLSFGE